MSLQNSMSGKVCLVTGATAGIGLETARELARRGAVVVGVGRSAEKSASVAAQIRQQTGSQAVEYLLADLSQQSQVRRLAQEFRARYSRLDVLVNNAGAFFMKRYLSADGLELTFALNHLSPFLLTNLLLETLIASGKPGAAARVVNVSSGAHFGAKLDFNDLQSQRYSGWGAYSLSKLANVLFTYELARRLADQPVTANVLHPGFVASNFATNNGRLWRWVLALMKPWTLTPERGAQTSLLLATSPKLESVTGKYFDDQQREMPSAKISYDRQNQQRLWQTSLELTGLQ